MSSFEEGQEGQKVILDIIHFLAYKGHFNEMHIMLCLGKRNYGIVVNSNPSLEMRLKLVSSAGFLTNEVTDRIFLIFLSLLKNK
jgi:hypothetical protein